MKINNQSMPFSSTIPKMITPNSTDEFDQLLLTPGKHTEGGDYYMQHQSQLQNSALTFNPLDKQKSNPGITLSAVEHNQIQHKLPTESYNITPMPQTQRVTNIVLHTSLESVKEISDLVPVIQQMLTSIAQTGSPSPLKQSKVTQPPVLNQPMEMPEVVYKKHQLFVNQNTAELTLSTTYLSKQQTHELKKLIKQWLADKGLTIKQWIINGEQQ